MLQWDTYKFDVLVICLFVRLFHFLPIVDKFLFCMTEFAEKCTCQLFENVCIRMFSVPQFVISSSLQFLSLFWVELNFFLSFFLSCSITVREILSNNKMEEFSFEMFYGS
jgi:hypothetical protein